MHDSTRSIRSARGMALVAALCAVCAVAGCTVYVRPAPADAVFVMHEPPPPRYEVIVVRPGPTYIWVAGYWGWRSTDYVWIPGRWVVPPPNRGRKWSPGRWKHERRGWYWVEGRWR